MTVFASLHATGITRRSFNLMASMAALTGFLTARPAPAKAAAPQAKYQAPGFYRTLLGDCEITVLSDGTVRVPLDTLMSHPDKVRAVLTADHETLPVELSINAFLVNTGDRLILIDAGAGELLGPQAGGQLVANLRAAGYQPEQVDHILLTHIHADHSGGLSIGGRRVFPNALVHIDRRDPDFWLSQAAQDAAPAEKKNTFRQSRATVDPYVLAGKLRPFDGAGEIFPGIQAVPVYGHTPGHTAYLIESRGHRLLLWGDIIHSQQVQFTDPDISIGFDVAPTIAVTARRKILAKAADAGDLVGGAHISFPGLGHIRTAGEGYAWTSLAL